MKKPHYRWFVVALLFGFMLLHQADRLLIGPMTDRIMDTFQISKTQMGAVSTGALIVGALLFPLWGYLYDRYARAKLLALAAFIWGSTTWLNAIVPGGKGNYPFFLMTRASTGIDDSSYPGLYSLVSDYFGPRMRGKIYGFLQLSMPLGYLVGMILGLQLSGAIGWRGVFYITGSLGVLLSIFLFLGLKEPPRGQSEPEMDGLEKMGTYRFDWKIAKGLFRIRSLRLMFLQGFFGTFPWNAITYWFFAYLQEERGYDDTKVMITMMIAVLVLAAGYPLGGALGDHFFRRTPRGRLLVSIFGVVAGLILMTITLNIPNSQEILFLVLLSITALFVPFSSPNVVATVYDVSLPEVRSTAAAVQSFIEEGGTALSPLMVGIIADALSLKAAFLIICITAWALCAVVYAFAAMLIPKDIEILRSQMRQRAEQAKTNMPATPHPSDVTYG